MWTLIKNNFITILLTPLLFISGVISAIWFEKIYRKFVRDLFILFNGDKINFVGKNFHLLASIKFVVAFGLFCSATFIILRLNKFYNIIKAFLSLLSSFFCTTILISLLDSKRLIIECTNCNEGVKILSFNAITYDFYFILSLIVSLLITSWLIFRDNKRKLKN